MKPVGNLANVLHLQIMTLNLQTTGFVPIILKLAIRYHGECTGMLTGLFT